MQSQRLACANHPYCIRFVTKSHIFQSVGRSMLFMINIKRSFVHVAALMLQCFCCNAHATNAEHGPFSGW